jgi:hypothetical protein
MTRRARGYLTAAAILLLLLGIARGAGAIILLLRGPGVVDSSRVSVPVASLLAVILLMVGIAAILSGLGLFLGKPWAWSLGFTVPFLFVLDGALNGYLLFGRPGDRGTVVNVVVALLILLALWLGRGEHIDTE